MLGKILSEPFTVVDQCGERTLSVLSIIRCPPRHGQSNTIHLGRALGPTKTAPLRGNRCGTLSAESTTATIRQRKTGSHCHQRILIMSAMSVLRRVASYPLQAYRWPGGNSGLHAEALKWSHSHTHNKLT